jgi:hypothetical protein
LAKLVIAKTAEVLELEDLSLSLLRRSMKAPRVTTTTASKSSPIDSLSFAVNLIFPFFDSPACGLVHVATTVSLTTCTSFNPFELPFRALTSEPVLRLHSKVSGLPATGKTKEKADEKADTFFTGMFIEPTVTSIREPNDVIFAVAIGSLVGDGPERRITVGSLRLGCTDR